jgi:uncharacterized protein YndB with AHSA1/START domain
MNSKTQTKPTPATLKIERVFNATPEKLWGYWTDPKKYAKWFNPSPADLVIHEFDVRVGGKIRFDMPQPDGSKNPQTGVFHKLDPYNEIVSGEPDRSFLLQVLFVPMGPKNTRLVVNVTGVPPEYHAMATEGWGKGLDKLEKLVGGAPPIPKTTGENKGFTIERTFKAAPEKVWKMWTTKEGLMKWWAPSAKDMGYEFTVRAIDVRVGGKYDFEMKDKTQTLHNHGVYREVVPNRRLAITWIFDIFLAPGEKPYDVPITIDLEPVSGGTKMTFKQGPLATAEHSEGSRQGVLSNFEKLAKALDG